MGQQVLPFYLVCDESGSMQGEPLDSINKSLPELHAEIGAHPVVADKAHFSIIAFSDDAEVVLELSDLSQVEELPVLTAKGGTNFAAVMRCLKSQIEKDVARLKTEGHSVFRPVVFFLTDGYPTDDWAADYHALTDSAFPYHPKIVAFGIGNADAQVVSAIATFRAFMEDRSQNLTPAQALTEFASAMTGTIISTGSSRDDEMNLQVPDSIPGFTSLSVDLL